MRRNKVFFALLMVCGIVSAPANAASPLQASVDRLLEKPGSYYYYLVSQFKSFAQQDKEAGEYLELALEADPHSSFLWTQKAYLDARLGNLGSALKAAQNSLAENPTDVDALLLMGKIESVRQKPQSAIGYYTRALAVDPKNEEAYNLLARDQLFMGNKAAAVAALGKCLAYLPESASCLYYLGSVHYEEKNNDQALRYFNLLVELYPEQSRALNTIGEIYIKKGQYAKAIEAFEQLAQLNPSDLVSQIRIGLLYYQMKDLDSAIREFRRISARFPKADKVNYFLGLMYLEQSDWKRSYRYFDRVGFESSFFKDAFNRQLYLLKRENRLAEGVAIIEKKFKKGSSEYFQTKIALELMTADYRGALSTLNRALKKYKNDRKLLFQRAVVYDKMGEWDKTRDDLEELLRDGQGSAEVYNYLGYGMVEHGEDIPTALRYIGKALELSPNEGHIMDSQAWAYFKMNQPEKALPILVKANRLEPEEPTILEHLGDVCAALKDKKRARGYYEASLKLLNARPEKTAGDTEQIAGIQKKLAEF